MQFYLKSGSLYIVQDEFIDRNSTPMLLPHVSMWDGGDYLCQDLPVPTSARFTGDFLNAELNEHLAVLVLLDFSVVYDIAHFSELCAFGFCDVSPLSPPCFSAFLLCLSEFLFFGLPLSCQSSLGCVFTLWCILSLE